MGAWLLGPLLDPVLLARQRSPGLASCCQPGKAVRRSCLSLVGVYVGGKLAMEGGRRGREGGTEGEGGGEGVMFEQPFPVHWRDLHHRLAGVVAVGL